MSIRGANGSLEFTADEPTLTVPASRLAAVGDGNATVAVRQVGDWMASHPASCAISINEGP